MWQDVFYHTAMLYDQFTAPRASTLFPGRFSHAHELKPFLSTELDDTSLLLGESIYGRVLKVSPTPIQKELAHIMLVGRSRSGKGLNVETNILTWPFHLIVVDIKGELYKRTAGFRNSLGQRVSGKKNVFVASPTGYGDCFDPLEARFTDSDLQSAATTLLHRPNEGQNAIFTDSAITMLTQIFHAGRLEGERLLPFAQKLIYAGLFGAATILEIISQKHNVYPNLATRFLDIDYERADFKDKFLISCWGTLTRRMNRLLTKESVRTFSGSDISARDIITAQTPVTLYLQWPERDLLSFSPLLHLVLNSLLDNMIDTYDSLQGRGCRPVLVILDEIARTGFPGLKDYVSTAAGRHILLMPVVQSLAQIDSVFGVKDARTICANMGAQIVYPPAAGDHLAAEDLARALGDRSGFASSRTEYERGASTGESEQRIPLMSPQELKLLDDEEVIGFRNKLRPFRLRRLDWRRFPELVKRASMKPPVVPNLPAIQVQHQYPQDFGYGTSRSTAIPLFLGGQAASSLYPE